MALAPRGQLRTSAPREPTRAHELAQIPLRLPALEAVLDSQVVELAVVEVVGNEAKENSLSTGKTLIQRRLKRQNQRIGCEMLEGLQLFQSVCKQYQPAR